MGHEIPLPDSVFKESSAVKIEPQGSPQPPSFPEDSREAERKAQEQAAREFVETYFREHGTPPKWELLLKDPKFAAAVAAEDERIRREAAEELCARYAREKQLQDKIEEDQKAERQRLIKEAKAKGGVRASLLEGTEGLADAEILDRIMNNYKKAGFKYSSINKSGDKILNGALDGDCRSLADSVATLAQEIGINGAAVKGAVKDFMVPGAPIVDPQWGTGNANRQKAWIFQNHYWVEYQGNVYDILFTRRSVNLGVDRQGNVFDDPETGLTCEVYGGVTYYAGMINGKYERYVTLSEGELQKLREEHRQKLEKEAAAKVETSDEEEEEEEQSPLDQIKEMLTAFEDGPVPKDKVDETAQRLLERDPGGEAPLSTRLKAEIAKFCNGTGYHNFAFNEEKWKKWSGKG
jgi:hypothetical protein